MIASPTALVTTNVNKSAIKRQPMISYITDFGFVHIALLAAVSAALASCSQKVQDKCEELASMLQSDPEKMAIEAKQRGDLSPLSLGGLAPEIPGYSGRYRDPRELPGTKDTATPGCRSLRKQAANYAYRYNLVISQ
jgi:hypothetical protein